jgi:hypothetical protein
MSLRHITEEEFAVMTKRVGFVEQLETKRVRGGGGHTATEANHVPVPKATTVSNRRGSDRTSKHRESGINPAPSPSIQSFFIPGPLPGANDIIRKHWRVYSRLKVKWGQAIALVLLVYKIQPVRACVIRYQWVEPTPVRGHIRDRDNIRFGAKFINDALVSQGILLDDGPDGVVSLTDSFTYDGVTPGVQVTIEEVQQP